MWLGYKLGTRRSDHVSFLIGSAAGPLIFPLLIALLFSIGRRFRNQRSRTRVVFWTSVVILLSSLAQLK
jgi:hypothetical protein